MDDAGCFPTPPPSSERSPIYLRVLARGTGVRSPLDALARTSSARPPPPTRYDA